MIAPSRSVADVLKQRGVRTPIEVVPTGVEVKMFARGDRRGFRARHQIGDDRLVVSHLGRLAPEKNLDFLARAVAAFLSD